MFDYKFIFKLCFMKEVLFFQMKESCDLVVGASHPKPQYYHVWCFQIL